MAADTICSTVTHPVNQPVQTYIYKYIFQENWKKAHHLVANNQPVQQNWQNIMAFDNVRLVKSTSIYKYISHK